MSKTADPAPEAPAVPDLPGLAKGVYDLLAPLSADHRTRVIRAAFALFGDPTPPAQPAAAPSAPRPAPTGLPDDEPPPAEARPAGGRSAEAQAWLRRNGISDDLLDQYFHSGGGRQAVIDVPATARTKKEQVVNAYLMQGIAALLTTGAAEFNDDDARDLCRTLGCFDNTNHAKAYKEFGNRVIGSSGDGWRLTAPGLQAAAALLKGGPVRAAAE